LKLLELDVACLRAVYNKLVVRRNPHYPLYDVFWGRMGLKAKESFEKLALILRREKINPREYLCLMFLYGKFEYSKRKLPYPWYLSTEKALNTFKWLLPKESKKYYDRAQIRIVGTAIKTSEILSEVQDSKESWDRIKVFKNVDAKEHENELLFMNRHVLSSWFLALFDNFSGCDLYPWVEPDIRKYVKSASLFYRHNSRIKARALEILVQPKKKSYEELKAIREKREEKERLAKTLKRIAAGEINARRV
jgi:hypothetical protein